MVELGGTGRGGGRLLYSGPPAGLSGTSTAKLLRQPLEGCPTVPAEVHSTHVLPILPETDPERMQEIARRTVDEYLSVVIPNNIFFSRPYSTRQIQDVPFLHLINFSERIRYDISLYAALGIRENLIACAYASHPEEAGMLRYVLNEESPTGKCSRCGGSGTVTVVDEAFL